MSKRPSTPARMNWKAHAARLRSVLADIAKTCAMGSDCGYRFEDIGDAVKTAVATKEEACNQLAALAEKHSDIVEQRDAMKKIAERMQARNRALAGALRNAEAVVDDLCVLVPIGAQHRALEDRRNRGGTNYGAYTAVIEPGPGDRNSQQADELGAAALNAARDWRVDVAGLAATEAADGEAIRFGG